MSKQIQSAYQLSLKSSDQAWDLIQVWTIFARTIIGSQFVDCLDKVTIALAKAAKSSNDDEKFDHLHKSSQLMIEIFVYLDKARRRKLISKFDYQNFYVQFNKLDTLINQSIKIYKKN